MAQQLFLPWLSSARRGHALLGFAKWGTGGEEANGLNGN